MKYKEYMLSQLVKLGFDLEKRYTFDELEQAIRDTNVVVYDHSLTPYVPEVAKKEGYTLMVSDADIRMGVQMGSVSFHVYATVYRPNGVPYTGDNIVAFIPLDQLDW